ncbi:hypothetical protein CCP3SC1AL1_280004 [Gammaproteobacteria bacterium]
MKVARTDLIESFMGRLMIRLNRSGVRRHRAVRSTKVVCNSQGAYHDDPRFLGYLEHQLRAVGLKVMRVESDNDQTLGGEGTVGICRPENREPILRA